MQKETLENYIISNHNSKGNCKNNQDKGKLKNLKFENDILSIDDFSVSENKIILTYSNINDYLDNVKIEKEEEGGEIAFLVKYINEVDRIKKFIENDLEQMKNFEIERIGREILINQYERTYNTNIRKVYSAIVGSQNLFDEMKKYFILKGSYYKSLEACKFLNNSK